MRYNRFSVLSFLTAVLLADFATPLEHWGAMQVKHSWDTVPVNWEGLGHPPAGTRINLNIAVKPEREGALADALARISNPRHQRYGAYLSKEQVTELVRPHPESLHLIKVWLVHHGIRSSSISITHGGGWLTVTDVLVPQANQLLGASYQLYRNAKTNETITRTVGYQLPTVLHSLIQTVAPTTNFPSGRVTRQIPHRRSFGNAPEQAASGKLVTAPSSRNNGIWPGFLQWMYQTSEYVPAAVDRNRLAVVGFDNEFPSQDDLTRFTTVLAKSALGATFTVAPFNGGVNNPNLPPGSQANGDVQYASTMAFPTPLVFYSVGGVSEWEPNGEPIAQDRYLIWLHQILNQPDIVIPQTISLSYGLYEPEIPLQYSWAVCNLFMQFGARGVSVLVASGSQGVGPENCQDANGNLRFMPEFPATCPYVTVVGGTAGSPEVGASLSGGGFSVHYPRPRYQSEAVNIYLNELNELEDNHAGRFNHSGRAYPDIAAQAFHCAFVLNDLVTIVDGTPCAVSTVAGIISLINDFLLSEDKPTLGFLNPWLYGKGRDGLKDIKWGSNPGCDTDGFPATEGWDPVTGLGTLKFRELLEILPPETDLPQPAEPIWGGKRKKKKAAEPP